MSLSSRESESAKSVVTISADYPGSRFTPEETGPTVVTATNLLRIFTIEPASVEKTRGVSLGEFMKSALPRVADKDLATARRDLASALASNSESGSRIRTLRLEAGLSQAEVAARLETSQAYIVKLEKGKILNPNLKRAKQLAVIYGVELEIIAECFNS